MKKWFVRWLAVALMLPGLAYAQVLPATSTQRAVAGLIEKNMSKRGFASNDPRWANTLQSGGSAIPYDSSNPITSADASTMQSANPASWPTVGDITSPQSSASGSSGASPWALPSSATAPVTPPAGGNDTPPITGPTLDWSIPAYGDQISKQSVSVSFVPTVFAAPTGCPAPITFQMFGKTSVISYGPFCDLMTVLAPLFLACGAAAAALIFAESLKS